MPPCRRAEHAHAGERQPWEVAVVVGVLDAAAAASASGEEMRSRRLSQGAFARAKRAPPRRRSSAARKIWPRRRGRCLPLPEARERWEERRGTGRGEMRDCEREARGVAVVLRGGAALGELRARGCELQREVGNEIESVRVWRGGGGVLRGRRSAFVPHHLVGSCLCWATC